MTDSMTLKIVFLCVANSARSQMAEGLARQIFGSSAEIASAGSQPSHVNLIAIEALREIGVDISGQRSKSTDEIDFKQIDLIVTLCAEEICPVVPVGIKKLHWPFPDPAAPAKSPSEQMQMFRTVRDQLRARLGQLRTELGLG